MDELVLPLMDDLLHCLTAELEATYGGGPCVAHLAPGARIVADRCSCTGQHCGGQAWVRLDRTYPVLPGTFTQDTTAASCTARTVAVLELGVLRCVPLTAPGTKGPPTVVQLTDAVMVATDDARAMRCVALDCWPGRDRVLGMYAALDSGDCGGGTQLVTVTLGALPRAGQTRSGVVRRS